MASADTSSATTAAVDSRAGSTRAKAAMPKNTRFCTEVFAAPMTRAAAPSNAHSSNPKPTMWTPPGQPASGCGASTVQCRVDVPSRRGTTVTRSAIRCFISATWLTTPTQRPPSRRALS